MKRFIPQSLFGRSLVVLVVGLLVTHVASVAVYYSDSGSSAAIVGGGHVAERIATVVQLFEEAPSDERPWLAHATSRPGFIVSWGDRPALPADAGGGFGQSVAAAMLSLSLSGIKGDRLRVAIEHAADRPIAAHRMPGMPGAGPAAMPPDMEPMMRYHNRMMGPWRDGAWRASVMRASVGLSDGSWLNLDTALPPRPPFWSGRPMLSLLVMIISVVILAAWAVRRMTGPLETVARAADRLGRDMHAPPLPESGPSEVRRAARAFNHMQERIRGLVDARTRLVAAISHDLRTPVTRMRLRAEFIEDGELREKTLADLGEMEDMVASVLRFARDDAVGEKSETVDLASLLQSVCDDMADTGQACEFAGAPRTPYTCRPLALRRAVTNLIENAANYGTRARVSLHADADEMVIRVDDDGPGIPESELAAVFKPFYRLEQSRSRETGGTGLGLFVVQSVAQAHGGEARLSNRPEGGLRAELVLPN